MFDNLGINVYVCIFFELNEIPNWKLKAHTNVYLSELDPLIAVIRERAIPGSTPGIYSQLIDKNAGLKMEKFNKAQAKNLAAAQKLVDTYFVSMWLSLMEINGLRFRKDLCPNAKVITHSAMISSSVRRIKDMGPLNSLASSALFKLQ